METNGYAIVSACCISIIVLIARPRVRRCVPWRRPAVGSIQPDPGITLILQLLATAVGQGTSIPRALEVIGESVAGSYGTSLVQVARALHRAVPWRDAWVPVLAAGRHEELSLIRDALEDAWDQGVSPVGRLDVAVKQIRMRRRGAIERGASRLAIRLLVPTGLCFLPAFILIGVIPSIGSFSM